MKKIILAMFLTFSVLSFSRYVEKCQVLSINSCRSLASGRVFRFKNSWFGIMAIEASAVHKVFFEGKGYDNLRIIASEELEEY